LFSQSRKGLFNIDDEYGRRAYENATCDKRTFGIIERGDAFATEIDIASINESSFFYREKNLIFKASLKLTGAFNVYNTIAALKCVIDLGIKPCVAKYALEKIEGVSGRMEIIKGSITAVIDYAHTPSAFYNCLKTLKSILNTKQKLFVVFGCGGNRDASKRSVFGNYADLLADEIIITEDNSRSEAFEAIAAEIASGIKSTEYKIIKDRENAIKYAFRSARPNDVIAVIGKGHEKYKIIQNTYIPFDEKKIILDSMREAEAKK
jgi:UDP-N-acetylmuramoyl-L-alanyl-D-glutamate--2,6-diaminopimelate ligase